MSVSTEFVFFAIALLVGANILLAEIVIQLRHILTELRRRHDPARSE